MAKRKAGPRWRLCLLMPALLVAACTVGPDFVAPRAWFPKSWFSSQPPGAAVPSPPVSSQPVAKPIERDWWAGFDDPELTSLEKRVAAANLDVRAATIRLAESRAERRITGAAEFPQINGSASYARQLPSEKGVLSLFGTSTAGAKDIPSATTGTQIPAFNLWQYGFDASWELDLWGRVRRSIEAADATIEASAEARRDTLLSILAEVARDYIQLRGTQAQLRISRANLRIAQESLTLTKKRAADGLATELDVADAGAQVSTTEATIPRLEEQQAQAINRLSFLLGEPPRALAAELATPQPIPPVPPKVPVGLPSELARRRPDIRQAEARLHAQTAEIGVAVANFYPSISLNGSFALQAVEFKDLGNWAARTYTIGPSISLPIFEGGRLTGNLELTKAQQQEAAILYQRTVLAAWQEVDDALTAYAAEQHRRERLALAVQQNRRALELSLAQYKQGLVAFLQVLTAEQQLLATEQQTTDSTTTASTNLVSLYKALGGGWEGAFPRQEQDKAQGNAAVVGGR